MKLLSINKWKKVFNKPTLLLDYVVRRYSKYIHNDKLFLTLRWFCCKISFIDWINPLTFCEKLQYLKLYDRNPLYTTLVDKVKVKEYVAGIIGERYIIPTLGVWERAEDINFEILPDKFVLKCNHNSGTGMCICINKLKLDKVKVKRELDRGLKEDYYMLNREWPYKNVKRKILAEKFMSDGNEDLTDYKFFCFNGEPKYCQVIKDRNTKETIDFFDMDWKHQEFVGLNPASGPAIVCPTKPRHYDEMKSIARRLSYNIPFCRIDLYEINDRVYFGEITFFPMSGFGHFTPKKWDCILGSWIKLPRGKEYKQVNI